MGGRDVYPAIIILLLSGVFWALLRVVKSFGHYTRRIEESNERTRTTVEGYWRDIDRARDEVADWRRLRDDIVATCPHTERSA